MVENIQSVNTGGKKYSVSVRLREERTRLGMSQAVLAEALNVTKWTVMNYEKQGGRGTPIPADLLAVCAKLGMDVQYILSGVHSSNLSRVAEEAGAYQRVPQKSLGALSPQEEQLVEKYRRLKPQHRTHTHAIVDALVSAEGRKVKNPPPKK